MWPKVQLLAATAAVIAVCLLVTAEAGNTSEAASTTDVRQLLPLPTVSQNATTPQSYNSNDDDDAVDDAGDGDGDDDDILSDSAREVSPSPSPTQSLVNGFDS